MALPHTYHETELCVVGGGMAGLFAAVAAARHGIKVILMQERPVLGGNASGEIRMWISGAAGCNNRETGLLEELRMVNSHRNPTKLYPIWDTLLYEMAIHEPNIELMLNCSCMDAEMDGNRIVSVTGWQMTTQTFRTVKAKYFADCSGDSILAPLTGAEYRAGREAASEFSEEVSTQTADRKTMGNTCLIQARKYAEPSTFIAPEWATKLTPEVMGHRRPNLDSDSENFWYLELGGDRDTIGDAETIRNELVALAMGMWDYVKNSGEFPGAEYWQLDFLGFLPGKRESRRYVGDYILTQGDILSGGRFPDTVAFGGWPLDDHDPNGFYKKGQMNTNIHTPAPYGIPYRSLYSRNIDNLFFAGRNLSATHAALSSTRVMATCSLLGQAIGTAAAIAAKQGLSPRGVYEQELDQLRQTLMFDDSFIPFTRRTMSPAAQKAVLASDGEQALLENLRNGADRNNWTYGDEEQGYFCAPGTVLSYTWDADTPVKRIRLLFDSDLDRETLPIEQRIERMHSMRANVPLNAPVLTMPKTLMKSYRVEVLSKGQWEIVAEDTENIRRLAVIPLGRSVRGIRVTLLGDWGDREQLHLFSFDVD